MVAEWIDNLIENMNRFYQAVNRKSFGKELTLLGVILRNYDEHEDDAEFKFPIKARHRKAVELRKEGGIEDRDLSYDEFVKVAQAFDSLKSKNLQVLKALFVLQFRQALRISEAAELHWEDLKMDFRNPQASSVRICRHVGMVAHHWHRLLAVVGLQELKRFTGLQRSAFVPGKLSCS